MMWTMPVRRLLSVCLGLTLGFSGIAEAELVLLRNGDVLKVTTFEVGPEKARLTLPSGGVLTLGTLRIERILEDEIVEISSTPEEASSGIRLGFRSGDEPPATPFGPQIHAAARRHDVNPALVAAMARAESAFDARAVSPKGARGLLQLMPATASRFGVSPGELFDPARNLEAGVRYLAWLVRRFEGDAVRVVAAYNAGEGAVDRYGGVPPYRETREYLAKVMGLMEDGPSDRSRATRLASR